MSKPSRTINLSPLSKNREPYTCIYAWPDDCYVQAGDNGLVLSRKSSYHTAFFETFPKSPSTFIRGEGPSVEDAEQSCWKQYQRILTCQNHEFERRDYRNGCGVCKHCGLRMNNIFDPMETCMTCGKPTYFTEDSDGNWYCEEHQRNKPLDKWRDVDWHIAMSNLAGLLELGKKRNAT